MGISNLSSLVGIAAIIVVVSFIFQDTVLRSALDTKFIIPKQQFAFVLSFMVSGLVVICISIVLMMVFGPIAKEIPNTETSVPSYLSVLVFIVGSGIFTAAVSENHALKKKLFKYESTN